MGWSFLELVARDRGPNRLVMSIIRATGVGMIDKDTLA
jgi:hypothetical protein